MSLLQMNIYRDSWAYKSLNGFPRPKQFEEQVRQSYDNNNSNTLNNVNNAISNNNNNNNNNLNSKIENINRTLTEMQFKRPSSAGVQRSKSANNRTRPQTAGYERTNNNTNNNSNNNFNFTFESTHTQSVPQFSTYNSNNNNNNNHNNNNNSSSKLSSSTSNLRKIPNFIAFDKQVLRFYCHFFDSNTQLTYKPIRKFNSAPTTRHITLHYFLEDQTFEMFSDKTQNSGIQGGPFYKRGILKKSVPGGNGGILNEILKIEDINIGGSFSALGRDFFVTDCDEFTREYYRRVFGVTLQQPLDRPALPDPLLGASNATGLQSTNLLSSTMNSTEKNTNRLAKKGHGTRSMDYFSKKEQFEKTQHFLASPSGSCLKFDCVELNSNDSNYNDIFSSRDNSILISPTDKQYDLIYSLCDDMIEVRMKKETRFSSDEPSLLLKKTKLPKNWKTARTMSRTREDEWREDPSVLLSEYYTFRDLKTGKVIDVYGKKLLLVNCDEFTKKYYQNKQKYIQRPIEITYPEGVKYEIEVPVLGDGYLAIGSEADTLHTVMGHPKPTKNWKKIQRNLGQIIRCRCKMLTDNKIDETRVFNLTFYLEDDTLAIYEENIRNSGITGGYFLKRGSYVNELPPGDNSAFIPRPFHPTDIYLGNILGVNSSIYQVIEMDDMSIRFCEENSDEYPYFDTLAIIQHVIGKVLEKRIDIRDYIQRNHDYDQRYWIDEREFVRCLEEIDIIGEMNDQEVMTVMRRFKEVLEGNMTLRKNNRDRESNERRFANNLNNNNNSNNNGNNNEGNNSPVIGLRSGDGRYFYHEFCDLFSYASFIEAGKVSKDKNRNNRNNNKKNGGERLYRLLDDMRGRQTQWRRAIRLDNHTAEDRYITGAYLASVFSKNGLKLSVSDLRLIIQNYSAPRDLLDKDPSLLQKLNRVLPSDELETTLEGEGGARQRERELKEKHHSLHRTLRGESGYQSSLSVFHDNEKEEDKKEKERKKLLLSRSILRTKSIENNGLEEEEKELSKAIINYHNLCNDIYICDWE